MRILLSLLLEDGHAALVTSVSPLTLILLMLHYVHPHDQLVTVDTGDFHIGARCLVHVNLPSEALGLAYGIGFTLNGLVLAKLVMGLHL